MHHELFTSPFPPPAPSILQPTNPPLAGSDTCTSTPSITTHAQSPEETVETNHGRMILCPMGG